MLSRMTLELAGEEDKKHGYYMGSLMQGVLMQRLPMPAVAELHEEGRHPYSQFIANRNGKLLWTVNTIGEDLRKTVYKALFDPDFDEIHLEHREEKLKIISRNESTARESDLVKRYYFGECPRYLTLRFLTPVSFKHNGQYVIFPSTRLILQSLMLGHDASSEENTVFTEEILADLEKYCAISRYQLRSASFPVGKAKIPSFTGTLTIRINGPQQMANLVWFLAEYGTRTGVGIKTGMGMGAYEIVENEKNRNTQRREEH